MHCDLQKLVRTKDVDAYKRSLMGTKNVGGYKDVGAYKGRWCVLKTLVHINEVVAFKRRWCAQKMLVRTKRFTANLVRTGDLMRKILL